MAHSHFSKDERNELSVLLRKGYSHRVIARVLGKHRSAVDREVKRNAVRGRYNPRKAQHKAYVRRHRAKYQNMKINESSEFLRYLEERLKWDWTPEQICGRWKLDSPERPNFSFKSVYKYLYSQFGQRLCRYLPSSRYSRHKRKGKKQKRYPVKNRLSIEQRPQVINLRRRFGDFEGDVLEGRKSEAQRLSALEERKSRKLFAVRVPRLKYAMDGFKLMLKPYQDILHSVTFDNGPENTRHLELGVKTYFCHPYSAWEKGQVENSLGRLRRFIKKRSLLSQYTDPKIQSSIERMNNTPRKCLCFKTPNEVFKELLLKVRKRRSGRVAHLRG